MQSLALLVALSLSAGIAGPKAMRGDPRIDVPGASRGVGYAATHGRLSQETLFGKTTPSFKDVAQGALGDCDLIGTFSAYAHLNPQAIERQFVHNTDGSLALDDHGKAQAIFYRRDEKTHVFHRETVSVDAELPLNAKSGRPEFTAVRNDKLWAAELEKAAAKWRGGWQVLNQGRSPAKDMEMLTGLAAHEVALSPTPSAADAIFKVLERGVKEGRLLAAGSTSSGDGYTHRDALARDSGLLPPSARALTFKGQGVVADHTYAIFDVGTAKANDPDFKRGQRFVTLRNPWDSSVPRGAGYGHGVFRLALEKFVLFYDTAYVGGRVGARTPEGEKLADR